MPLLPNLNLPLPGPTDMMAVWEESSLGDVTQFGSVTWLFSDLATAIEDARDLFDGTTLLIAPLLDSSNWVWAIEANS